MSIVKTEFNKRVFVVSRKDWGLTSMCFLCPGKRKSSRSASMRSSKTNSWVSTNATLPRDPRKSSMASAQGSTSQQTNKIMNFLLGGKRKWDSAALILRALKVLPSLQRAGWNGCGAQEWIPKTGFTFCSSGSFRVEWIPKTGFTFWN